MKNCLVLVFVSSIMIGLSYGKVQMQAQKMEEGKKPVSYQVGSGKGYTISGPGFQAQGQQSNGDSQQVVVLPAGHSSYSVSGPGYQAQGQQSEGPGYQAQGQQSGGSGYQVVQPAGSPATVITYGVPSGHTIVTDSRNKSVVFAQKLGRMGQLQGVVDQGLMQGQIMPGMGQMQGMGLQGQQMNGMVQMQG